MKFRYAIISLISSIFVFTSTVFAQKDSVHFTLSLQHPEKNMVHVTLQCNIQHEKEITFKMPQWTPGYYQIMNYANNVKNFSAIGSDGKSLAWKKTGINAWTVSAGKEKTITLEYDVIADSAFVATSFIDTTHAYLTPAATFLYVQNRLQTPVSLNILSYKNWSRVATGLDSVAGKTYQYTVPDFDMLYDCPILAGNLEELPSFTVKEFHIALSVIN